MDAAMAAYAIISILMSWEYMEYMATDLPMHDGVFTVDNDLAGRRHHERRHQGTRELALRLRLDRDFHAHAVHAVYERFLRAERDV